MQVGKPPTFSGEENVRGFIRDFEEWCLVKGMDGLAQLVSLKTSLRDEAKTFAQNFQFSLTPSYTELKDALLEAYG